MSTTQNKVAIVTGAAQGIGRAIALQLASDGLSVVVSDIAPKSIQLEQVAAEITSSHPNSKALVLPADVTSESEVNNLVARTVQELGGLHVMVANAGIFHVNGILDVSVAEWDRVFSVNLIGTLLCYKAAAKIMIEQKCGGRIIGASSIAGKKAPTSSAAYAASKAAVRSLTQSAACELGTFGITVNAYAPGAIDTPMLKDSGRDLGSRAGITSEDYVDGFTSISALKRIGTPKELAGVVSFLASDKSSFITGQTITVDGGIWYD